MIITSEHLAENFIENVLKALREEFNARNRVLDCTRTFDEWLYLNSEKLGLAFYETLGDHLGSEIV